MTPLPEPRIVQLFQRLVAALDDFPAPYAFIGAVARNAWGRPRTTTDLDLEMSLDPASLEDLEARLSSLGVSREGEIGPADATDPIPDNLIYRSSTGIRIDVLVTKTGFQAEALKRLRRVQVLGSTTSVISPEDLIVYKLIAGRARDDDDIEDVLGCRSAAGQPIDWNYIDEWAEAWGVQDRWQRMRERIPT